MFKTRNLISGLMLVLVLATLAGCSSMSVNYDYDNNVEWKSFKTYAWMPISGGTDDPTGSLPNSQLLSQRIQSSVSYEMDQRGIAEGDPADLLVVYHLGTQEKIQVTDWGYNYSPYYYGYGGRNIDVYQFTEGSLVIDLVDAKTKNLVWRGTGTGTVNQKQRTPEEWQSDIDNVVHKIMKSFPPE